MSTLRKKLKLAMKLGALQFKILNPICLAQSSGAVEYTDCVSAKG